MIPKSLTAVAEASLTKGWILPILNMTMHRKLLYLIFKLLKRASLKHMKNSKFFNSSRVRHNILRQLKSITT